MITQRVLSLDIWKKGVKIHAWQMFYSEIHVSIKQASSISKLFEVFDEVVRNYKTTTACLVAIVLQIFSPKVQKNTYSSTI